MSDMDPNRDYDVDEESGRKGGAMEAHMASAARPVTEAIDVAIGFVQWSSVATGAIIALAIMILLNSLGAGIGLALTRAGYGGGLAIWMVAAATIALFIGSYLATRSGQIRSLWTGLVYGLTVWSIFMLLDVIGVDLFGGLSRFFYSPGVTSAGSATIRHMTMASGLWYFVGYLIALIGALLGAASGVTVEETEHRPHRAVHQH